MPFSVAAVIRKQSVTAPSRTTLARSLARCGWSHLIG